MNTTPTNSNTRVTLHAISDEISWNLRQAMDAGMELGIRVYDLRMAGETRFPNWTPEDMGLIEELVRQGEIEVAAVSAGTFKEPFSSARMPQILDEELPRLIEAAHRVGARCISLFSPTITEGAIASPSDRLSPSAPPVAEAMGELTTRANAAGLQVQLENCHTQWANSGCSAVDMIAQANNPRLRLLWDPANSIAGRAFWRQRASNLPPIEPMRALLAEIEEFAGLIDNVHVRDIALEGSKYRWVPLGEGVIDWPALIARLREKGYQGPYTIEHHLPDKVEATRHVRDYLANYCGIH